MLLGARGITEGIQWVEQNREDENIAKTLEKAKKDFAGNEIGGKKLGVIGLGAIGVRVANAAVDLNMTVYGYDPYISIDGAWHLSGSVKRSKSIEEICRECDYITLHLPALENTKGMICEETISQMKDGVVVH
jgi:D-3-phosphoglycerate dehydrogenase